jgi:hypothetical protein
MPLYLADEGEEEEGVRERFRNLKEEVGRLERLQKVEVFVARSCIDGAEIVVFSKNN